MKLQCPRCDGAAEVVEVMPHSYRLRCKECGTPWAVGKREATAWEMTAADRRLAIALGILVGDSVLPQSKFAGPGKE